MTAAGLPTPERSPLLAELRKTEWVVYAKKPFSGPRAVLANPRGHTPRSHLESPADLSRDNGVTFKWKDYRIDGPGHYQYDASPTS